MKLGSTTVKSKTKGKTTDESAEKDKKYFDGWTGVDHIQYSGDYHTDGKEHLSLEDVAKRVAQEQTTEGKPAKKTSSKSS